MKAKICRAHCILRIPSSHIVFCSTHTHCHTNTNTFFFLIFIGRSFFFFLFWQSKLFSSSSLSVRTYFLLFCCQNIFFLLFAVRTVSDFTSSSSSDLLSVSTCSQIPSSDSLCKNPMMEFFAGISETSK